MRESRGQRTYQFFNYLILTVFSVMMLYPFWDVLRISFSTPKAINSMKFQLWPMEFTTSAYAVVFNNSNLYVGYKNTIIRCALSLAISIPLMILTAYPLSKRDMPGRNIFTMLMVFTMFFSGGLIPSYIINTQVLKLANTMWVMVLPGVISTYSMLIIRNNFMAIPAELTESAIIDGANEFGILLRIILPLSVPVIMTVILWDLVGNWNAWFDCIIYIRDGKKFVLQAMLRKIIIEAAPQFSDYEVMIDATGSQRERNIEAIKNATILFATVPILLIYPFIQKYFVKGVMIGSLKG